MLQSTTVSNARPTCLFLPETGLYPYTRALSIMGCSLQKEGRKVVFTRCSGQMPHCLMMAGNKVPLGETEQAKKYMCAQCRSFLDAAQKAYGFSTVDLEDLHTGEIQEKLDDIALMSPEELLLVKQGGSPAAQFAQYDFGLEAKVAFSPLETPEWTELFRAHVSNTVLAGYYAEAIAEQLNPSGFITFNQYSECNLVRHVAREYGMHYQSLSHSTHFNADCSHFWIYPEGFHFMLNKHVAQWPVGRDLPIPAEKVFGCWQDVVFRNQGQGSHIYSTGKSNRLEELFDTLGLSKDRKLLVAFTSSNDEAVGARGIADFWGEALPEERAFPDQISWLLDLSEWAQARSDVQVVVRIHPREGKGKNYNHESSHLEQLRQAFLENSDRFRLVWPEEPVSSYDLLELAHACIVPWTSMGMEASRIGVPVLSWVGNRHYADDDFIQVAAQYAAYRNLLDVLPFFFPSWRTLTRAVRFYHWRVFATCLDLSKTIPIGAEDSTIWPLPPEAMKKDIVSILDGDQGLVEYNLERWKRALSSDSEEREAQANKKGIRLYIDSLFFPRASECPPKQSFFVRASRKALRLLHLPVPGFLAPEAPKPFAPPTCADYVLKFSNDVSKLEEYKQLTAADSALRYLVAEDNWHVWLIAGGECVRRMSPLLLRLGKLFDTYANGVNDA